MSPDAFAVEPLLRFLATLPSLRGRPLDVPRWDLDSVDLLQVVAHLEESYQLDLSDQDVDPEEFRTLAGIQKLLAKHGRS
jgi:hypothetical protein